MITALLGLAIFGERLPALWWVGAAGLVVGNVIIGRREEGETKGVEVKDGDAVSLTEGGNRMEGYRDREVEAEGDGVLEGERGVVK